jgi:hypothetical protein
MRWLALMAVLAVAACGSIGAQAHTLSLGFKAGDAYKYKLHLTSKQTASMTGMSIPITLDIAASESVKVKSVDSSGVADLTLTLSGYTMKETTGGVTNTTTGIPDESLDIEVRADGTLVSINGVNVSGRNMLSALPCISGGFFVAAVLPDHAVKAGDTWSKTYDQSFMDTTGKLHVVSNSKYLRDETVNGVNAAVVETKSTGSIDMTPATGAANSPVSAFSVKGTFTTDVTTWVDTSGHRVVKSHATGHDDVTIDLPTMSTTASASPMMQGPITTTGDSTTDLNPA